MDASMTHEAPATTGAADMKITVVWKWMHVNDT